MGSWVALSVALLLTSGTLEAGAEHAAAPGCAGDLQPRGFLARLGRAYVHLASPGNLVVLGAGGVAALGAHPFDRRLTNTLRDSERLDGFFEVGDVAGGGFVQGGAALGTLLVGRLAHSRKVTQFGGDLVAAQIVSGTVTLGVKLGVRRDRPDGSGLSFPSGHASASFATATVLERHFGWKAGAPAYALATYIGASRLQENRHFASDVLFGAAVGITAGRAVTFDRARKRVALAPVVVPGGFGLAVVGVGR